MEMTEQTKQVAEMLLIGRCRIPVRVSWKERDYSARSWVKNYEDFRVDPLVWTSELREIGRTCIRKRTRLGFDVKDVTVTDMRTKTMSAWNAPPFILKKGHRLAR